MSVRVRLDGKPQTGWHDHPVNMLRPGTVVAVLASDTVLLMVVGLAMWSEAPSSAEEAVGKGLFALGVALAIPALVGFFVWLAGRASKERTAQPARSDWDSL